MYVRAVSGVFGGVNLAEWARGVGVDPQTAYRWFREGTLPVPARRVGPRLILVDGEVGGVAAGETVIYARGFLA